MCPRPPPPRALPPSGFGIGNKLVVDLASSGALYNCARLFMRNNRLTAVGARKLMPGLDIAALVFLDLGCNKLGPDGARVMAEAVGVRTRVLRCRRRWVCAFTRIAPTPRLVMHAVAGV